MDRLTTGTLLLIEPGHPDNPWDDAASPAAIPNLANDELAAVLGGSAGTATVAVDEDWTAASGRMERTPAGGVHLISHITGDVGNEYWAALMSAELQAYIEANPTHSYYVSLWGQITRATGSGYSGYALGGILSTTAGTARLGFYQSGATGTITTTPASSLLGRTIETGLPGGVGAFRVDLGDDSVTLPMLDRIIEAGNINATTGNAPSWIFYALYLEDLTVSGRSYATASAADAAAYATAFGSGGRYDPAPQVAAGADTAATINLPWTRLATFTAEGGGPWTAQVDYGDGAGPVPAPVDQDARTVTLVRTWTSLGAKTVTVTVDDVAGGVGSDTVTVTVREPSALVTGNVRVVRVGIIGLDGESADAARMSAIEANLTALLDRPVIVELASIPDVDTSGAADGDALIYDAVTESWIAGPVSGAIAFIKHGATLVLADADRLNFDTGLNVQQDGLIPTQANVFVAFAGTGTANTAARSDHTHTTPIKVLQPYSASGGLSSGSRVLTSVNVTPPNGVPCRIIARLRTTEKSDSAGSAYFKLFLNIWDGTTSQVRTSEKIQCVGGVPNPATFEHTIVATGNGSAWPVSASIIYDSEGVTNVGAGELTVEVYPAR